MEKNLSVLNQNIKKQNDEIEALDKMDLDTSSLEQKEFILDENLPTENKNLHFEQINLVYQIADEV
jgi:hypothetical protein